MQQQFVIYPGSFSGSFLWAVFLGNVLMFKVGFKTINSTKNASITKEGLQRSK